MEITFLGSTNIDSRGIDEWNILIFFYFMCITISGYAIAAFLLYTNGLFLLILLFLTKEEKIKHEKDRMLNY